MHGVVPHPAVLYPSQQQYFQGYDESRIQRNFISTAITIAHIAAVILIPLACFIALPLSIALTITHVVLIASISHGLFRQLSMNSSNLLASIQSESGVGAFDEESKVVVHHYHAGSSDARADGPGLPHIVVRTTPDDVASTTTRQGGTDSVPPTRERHSPQGLTTAQLPAGSDPAGASSTSGYGDSRSRSNRRRDSSRDSSSDASSTRSTPDASTSGRTWLLGRRQNEGHVIVIIQQGQAEGSFNSSYGPHYSRYPTVYSF